MKVALITSSAPFGKGESFVIAEANALANAGVQIVMVPTVLRAGEANRYSLEPNIRLVAHGVIAFGVLRACLAAALKNPVGTIRAIWALRCWNPIVLVKNLVVLPKALWLGDFVRNEGIEHIHAHWLSTPSTVAMVAAILANVPWSCTAHRGDIVANNLLCRKLLRARFVRFISASGIALAKKRCGNADVKMRLLHMGVEVPAFVKGPSKRHQLVVLCPANLIPVKGHRFLIEAWAQLPEGCPAKLLLAGDGELRKELQVLTARFGLEHSVEFVGHLPHLTLLRMYEEGDVDVVVLPSLDLGGGVHEGIPVSLMEAMAYGVPVISTATGGVPELLSDGGGSMVPQADPSALAAELARMLNDRDAALSRGMRGRVTVERQFNNKTIVEALRQWFLEAEAGTK